MINIENVTRNLLGYNKYAVKKCNFLDIALNHKEHSVDADREVIGDADRRMLMFINRQ